MVNLSYWVFPAFSTLKQLAPAYDWDALSANGLKLLSAARFGPLRLPPDWLSLGGPAPAPAEKFPTQFGYNAIRIPLYLAWDSARRRSSRVERLRQSLARPPQRRPLCHRRQFGFGGTDSRRRRLSSGARAGALRRRSIRRSTKAVIKSRDPLYYPDTLRLLSLAAIQERFPQCF